MKKCDLCNSVATTSCESDQAILCWACDYRVHVANFIVAKHRRTLLCHSCQAPTPWTGSGSKLNRTVSVCEGCTGRREIGDANNAGEDSDDDEGDHENQVVAPSSASSSSSNGEKMIRV